MDLSLANSFELRLQDAAFTFGDLCGLAEKVAYGVGLADRLMVRSSRPQAVIVGLLACFRFGIHLDVIRTQDELLLSQSTWSLDEDYFICRESCRNISPTIRLQTSGTTGKPKLVSFEPKNLSSGLGGGGSHVTWLLTYEPGSFAGIQVILSALRGGHSLIVSGTQTSHTELVNICIQNQVTMISATPTFWRSLLRVNNVRSLPLSHITLGGEVADQATLTALKNYFPQSSIRHIYAATEIGVVFTVRDGYAGFPANWLNNQPVTGVGLSISEHGTLLILSSQSSREKAKVWWDSRDLVKTVGDRVYFSGRQDSVVNIGGLKVHPEEVEMYLLQLSIISDVKIIGRTNPITGAILVADIILAPGVSELDQTKQIIQQHLLALPKHARPVLIRYKGALPIADSGKKARFES